MPEQDRKGPEGRGPITGCSGGFCGVPLNTPDQEIEYLKNQEQALKKRLSYIRSRTRLMEIKAGAVNGK